MNIYTSKQNLWSSNKLKNDSLTKYLDKDKKLSVSLSKKSHSRESSMQKSKSQEKNNFYFDRRSDLNTSQSYSQGYLSSFKERLYPPKVKKSFKQDKVNFYFPKNNYR